MTKAQRQANWLSRQVSDPYNRQARKNQLRSRAWFKLEQICRRFPIFKTASGFLLDLGSAPGGWSQYLSCHAPQTCRGIIACDKLPMAPIPRVHFILGDFSLPQTLETLKQKATPFQIEVVLSDMAPDLTGCKWVDQANALALSEQLIQFCSKVLAYDGILVMKAFQGENFLTLFEQLKSLFLNVSIFKPAASRPFSSETYFIARKFRVH